MLDNVLFVLGASDPEMQAIESLLKDRHFGYAAIRNPDGNILRVHPGNAYVANCIISANGDVIWPLDDDHIVQIECAVRGFVVDSIDHHRPGDPGYGMPPELFFEASSIGQLVAYLCKTGLLHPEYFGNLRRAVKSGDNIVSEDQEIVMTAAADHCLEAAYRGKCPGVDPNILMAWRIKSRALFQGRSEAEVLADVERARNILRVAVGVGYMCEECGERGAFCSCGNAPLGIDYNLEYADLSGQDHIPELPEAACREGIPFIAGGTERDGRKKVVLQAASADLVKRFLAGEIRPELVDRYGDPARGFAGGYVPN